MAKYMLGIIQFGADEPFGSGHFPRRQHLAVWLLSLDIEKLPEGLPKVFDFGHRPLPKALIGIEGEAFLGFEPVHVSGNVGISDVLVCGFP